MSYYICSNCDYGSASLIGKCPSCNQWNTFVNKERFNSEDGKEETKKILLTPLSKIKTQQKKKKKTGSFEFDRVLDDGILPGEVILLTGEPGVGKSTLLLQSFQTFSTVYISGEESAEQVRDRAERLHIDLNRFYFSNEGQVEGIIEAFKQLKTKPEVIIIDSIQTVYSKTIETPAGSINQIKESANILIKFAKQEQIAVVLIGHITKDGDIAGPKTLEHAVDCVLNFEGEKISQYRILRTTKNRFGGIDEIGIFQMKQNGLEEVNNPLIFIQEENEISIGKSIVGTTEGNRSLFFEIQALVVPSSLGIPRRIVKGVDYNKLLILLAVMKKHLSLPLDSYDVHINVIGGVKITSPLADLGIISSVYSSFKNIPIAKKTTFIGEVGLLGEIRKGYGEEKIIREAKRLSFRHIYSSINIKNINLIKNIIRPL
ncbi:DNA repair protein RadA [Candidatus Roizmanbacteria bacterium CG_4_10_14_0_8_um_filter_33_9]|uniref:DNA repair protein RadA n=1 Tax=Candidatus Roizmanbacteria bacterium CG_4_10_14_0_8_um_filter_33_9 TaxID=1974826 RepID=A0A2M7QIP9_9BACT|nr:MAG: DNA repair protein RadA [Candidatus Roizmanbacteria bacterium CG_4_10_14_0_8_um_filter_33_9]